MSGRFFFLLAPILSTCVMAGPPAKPPPPEGPVEPVLEEGALPPARQAQAAGLFRRAREALAAGRPGEAVTSARRVVVEFPSSPVSGRALRLLAEAALADGDWSVADQAAGRYAALLPEADPRAAEMRLLQAGAMAGAGDQAARLERLLRLSPETPDSLLARATPGAREAVRTLSVEEIEAFTGASPPDRPLRPVLDAWLARLLVADGRSREARAYAQAALSGGAQGADSLLARAVLEPEPGELPPIPGRRTVRIGSILPLEGSPALRDVAGLIAEGVEVAAALDREGLEVELLTRDDAGDPAVAARLVEELEAQDILGAVGFLRDGTLAAAARSRGGTLPLVSPTAHTGPEPEPGVLSLAGADPVAAASVAAYGADQGYARVAILHSQVPESVEEARAMERALGGRGVPVVGSFAYPRGATFFQDQIAQALEVLRMEEIRALGLTEEDTLHVEELDPVALFVPIPAEDVEYVAPQLTFFGLDTLGIDIYGTSGWTDPQILARVDDRHTTGVVASAPTNAGPGSSGYARFQRAFEDYFQRSLVSPVPALGYDAALLLLEAVASGARTPRQVAVALEGIRDLEGATGVFSVVDGHVLRRQEVVRIVNGATIPAP